MNFRLLKITVSAKPHHRKPLPSPCWWMTKGGGRMEGNLRKVNMVMLFPKDKTLFITNRIHNFYMACTTFMYLEAFPVNSWLTNGQNLERKIQHIFYFYFIFHRGLSYLSSEKIKATKFEVQAQFLLRMHSSCFKCVQQVPGMSAASRCYHRKPASWTDDISYWSLQRSRLWR